MPKDKSKMNTQELYDKLLALTETKEKLEDVNEELEKLKREYNKLVTRYSELKSEHRAAKRHNKDLIQFTKQNKVITTTLRRKYERAQLLLSKNGHKNCVCSMCTTTEEAESKPADYPTNLPPFHELESIY